MGSEIHHDLPAPAVSSAAVAVQGLKDESAETQSVRAQKAPPSPSKEEGPKASAEVARILGVRDSSQDKLEVSVDKKSGVIVRIVDSQGNVVRQIPPEELIALAKRLDEVIGVLFDKKA